MKNKFCIAIVLGWGLWSQQVYSQDNGTKVRISKSTYMYSKPSTKGRKLGIMRKGQLWDFVKASRRKKWFQVSNGSVEGWVHSKKSKLVREKATDYVEPQNSEGDAAIGAADDAQFEDQWYEGGRGEESFDNQAPSGVRAHDYAHAQLPYSFEVDVNFGSVKYDQEDADDLGATLKLYYDAWGSGGDRFDIGGFLGIHMLDLASFESPGIEIKNSIVFQLGLTLRYLWSLGSFELGPELGAFINFPRLAVKGANAASKEPFVDDYNKMTFGFLGGLSVNYRFSQKWLAGLGFKYKSVSKEGSIGNGTYTLFNATLGYRF